MRPCISEFSYGFAITHELVRTLGPVTAAPVFPSLRAEGQQGGGWDVQIGLHGVLLFLQFKLCDQMIRRTCTEARHAQLSLPCYRMHLRPLRSSRQHPMLLCLEQQTNHLVYYCAPQFHRTEELNRAFRQSVVRNRSKWIRPSQIGPLQDSGDHHVSFEPGGRTMWFSEPKPIEGSCEFEDLEQRLANRLREDGGDALSEARLEELADVIDRIAHDQSEIGERERDAHRDAARRAAPLQRVAYYAFVFLQSQLFVVQVRGQGGNRHDRV